MKEYHIIYRDGDFYKVINGINNEDSAYEVLMMVIKAGYEDARIEVYETTDAEMDEVIEYLKNWNHEPTKENIAKTLSRWIENLYSHVGKAAHEHEREIGIRDETGISWEEQDLITLQKICAYKKCLSKL